MTRSRAAAAPERILWVVEQLELPPSAQVLEVGCGSGHALALLAERLPRGAIVGIDRSATQVEAARERNAAVISAGRSSVERLALEQAPERLGERLFHAVIAINVNAFWTQPEPSIDAVRRLLRKQGQLYLGYEPPSRARLDSLRQSLPAMLEERAIQVRDVRTTAFARSQALCVIGTVNH